MIFGTVCSGIGAPETAWSPLGWRAAFASEIAKFPRAVLAHHYPDLPIHGDFTTIEAGDYPAIDILCGGTPCQSFSVAGLRGGMGDERGNLALEYLRLARRLRPAWLVWENVPGVRSSAGGRDFGSFLGGLGQLGYGFAYRSLDAQYFGLAQQRERVFVVGYLGDWRPAVAVLFEPQSMRRNSPPSREARADVSRSVTSGLGESGFLEPIARCLTGHPNRADGTTETLVSSTLLADDSYGRGDNLVLAHTLRGVGFDASEDGTGRGTPVVVAPTLTKNGDAHSGFRDEKGLVVETVSFAENQQGELRTSDVAPCLSSQRGGKPGQGYSATMQGSAVRRLTPRECERLMGFPDDYTLIPWRRGMAPDGPRYEALGNSMAVPVMRWIGERIAAQAAL